MEKDNLEILNTETANPITRDIDSWETAEILSKINLLDQEVAPRVSAALPQITRAVDYIAGRFLKGGRLIYAGAGTSGRIGCMDAAECPPTFGVPHGLVTCLMAGGKDALFKADESIEDSPEQAANDLNALGLRPEDTVMAISSSGRTPYCIGALKFANELKAGSISLSCNKNSVLSRYAQIMIEVDTGPEAIMGSTRMKAGTAQKLVINMISTAVMVKTGRVYKNLMVCVRGTNKKLNRRIYRIMKAATGITDEKTLEELLHMADYDLKTAIVTAICHVEAEIARDVLVKHNGFVNAAIKTLNNL